MSNCIVISPLRTPLLESFNPTTPTTTSPMALSPSHSPEDFATTKFENPICGHDINGKTKYYITSERLGQLRSMVEDAIKEHRIFTIRGGWQTLRRAFLRRNWIEKCEVSSKTKSSPSSLEELCLNLPSKQTWETQSAHILKCERTIMSRLLQVHDVDFYWNTRKDNHDMQFRLSCNKMMSRFNRSLFTSKEGLCLLLQQMYWHTQPGVANVNFPRCYVLGFPDHYNNFVDDFRLTACVSILKYTVHVYETQDQYAIQSPEGIVPYSAFQFAMDRVNEFLATKKHMDIDVDIVPIEPTDWNKFLEHFHLLVHDKQLFLENKNYVLSSIVTAAKAIVKKVYPFWPQLNLDGMKNIWILKPGNKCRGRGIQLIKNVKEVARIMELKMKYVVQKYIEKPLIIYNTKFDIRQWFLITSVQPLVIWMYRESYLRFSSQTFSLDNFHESLHLTNHAVQCKYKNNTSRNKALPEDNMWDCYTFQSYLKNNGQLNKWETVIYPGMRESIIGAMLSCQDTMDRRPNTFELYGADFILAEDYKPWLLEINSSPDLSSSTSVTSRMCPQCLEDLVKVVIDKRRDPNCDTGNFDLIYKQNFPRPPPYLGMSLSVRGRRIFKRHRKSRGDKENDSVTMRRPTGSYSGALKKASKLSAPLDKSIRPQLNATSLGVEDFTANYRGPVIADLMEDLRNTTDSDQPDAGIELVQPVKLVYAKKRLKHSGDKVVRHAQRKQQLQRQLSPPNVSSTHAARTRNIDCRTPRMLSVPSRSRRINPITSTQPKLDLQHKSGQRHVVVKPQHAKFDEPNCFDDHVRLLGTKRADITKLINKDDDCQLNDVFKGLLGERDKNDSEGLLTVGKRLGRVMRPHT